jgi:hemerythrin-like domain-containing protein
VKRSAALIPLSHDHQHGLAVALDLTRATAETAPAAVAAFAEFWRGEGCRHFRIEEEILLPGFARHGPPDHDAVVRVLVDHVEIRRRADDLERAERPELDELHALGERLRDHIRHEERILFPLVEEMVPERELEELGELVAAAERGR